MLLPQAAGYRHPSQMNGPRPPPPGGERPGPGQPGPPPPGPPGPPPGSMFQQQQLQQLKAQIMAYRLLARNQPIPTNYLNLAIAGVAPGDGCHFRLRSPSVTEIECFSLCSQPFL